MTTSKRKTEYNTTEKRKKLKKDKLLTSEDKLLTSEDNNKQKKNDSVKKGNSEKNNLKKGAKHIKNKNQLLKQKKVKSFSKGLSLNSNNSSNDEKPNWSDIKKQKKDLRETRKKSGNEHFEASKEAKTFWENLRKKNTTLAEKKKIAEKVYGLLKNSCSAHVRTHDMSRVIQTLLVFEDIKNDLFVRLKDELVLTSKNKYGHHVIQSILNKNAHDQCFKIIFEQYRGNVVKLISSRYSCPLIEILYNKLNNKEKNLFKQELYGDLFKRSEDTDMTGLEKAFQKNPNMKNAILTSTKRNLMKFIEKDYTLKTLLVQSVLLDYLNNCEEEDKNEVIESLKTKINLLINNKDGVKVAAMVLWKLTTKEKKTLLKEMRSEILKICADKNSYLFLMYLIDNVDDKILINKLVLKEIVLQINTVASNEFGKKVLLYIIAHRDKKFFHPFEIKEFEKGDTAENKKKDTQKRIEELQQEIIPFILDNMAENPAFWLSDGKKGLLTSAILKAASQSCTEFDVNKVFESIPEKFASKLIEFDKDAAGFNKVAACKVLKQIIKDYPSFSETLAKWIVNETDTLKEWLNENCLCFLIVAMLETPSPSSVHETLKKKIKKLKNDVKDSEAARILINLISK